MLIIAAGLLCARQQASAQCYTLLDGNKASVVLDIKTLPRPEVTSPSGEVIHAYDLSNMIGNRVTVAVGSETYSVSNFGEFTIKTTYSPASQANLLELQMSNGSEFRVFVTLAGAAGDVFRNGLPAVLPAASQWQVNGFTGSTPRGEVSPPGPVTTISGKSCGTRINEATNNRQADFDGDGKADYAVWRPSDGSWYVLPTSNPGAELVQQWGIAGDVPVSGDYDGDGKTDYAVWRPSEGLWYIIPSGDPGAPTAEPWGQPGDIPVPGDYDGDGKTDYAVWRPSEGVWYIIPSSDPGAPVALQWGQLGDIPVPGDYDGDGKTDYAVWRPSEGVWYIIPSSDPGAPVAVQWGQLGDIPIPGDYDGDAKTDYAVWRPTTGTWYVIPSGNLTPIATQWGQLGDIPVPADYDGDSKTDYAVWRPATGTWYVIPSGNPTPISTQWGMLGDIPQ